jgi:uncharacterized protein YajQ (UPF0234 family)
MNKITKIRQVHDDELEQHCIKNNVSFKSIQTLLKSEKTKKLLKRNAMLQSGIDKEIDNAIENENR